MARQALRSGAALSIVGLFTMTAKRLEVEKTEGRENERKTVRARVSGPFEILGKSRNPKGGDWRLWLRRRDGDGRAHQKLVPFAALHGEAAALCQSLASEGLHIQIAKQRDFAVYLNGADARGRVTRVESTGWHSIGGREVFVLPLETIGPAGAETVILEGAANAPYEVRGTLAAWRASAGGLASGQVLPMLAVSAALAWPLLCLAGGEGDANIEMDHRHLGYGQISLMKAIGTTSGDFLEGFILQLANASKEKTPSEKGANFMLAVVKGIESRDQIEAMLAAQMAAVHMASMTFARRLAHVDNIPQQDSAERAFNKLTRTFAAQVPALKEYRSKGEQKMIVQHVNVAEGGQAIVGNVNAPAPGGGAREKTGDQLHALGYAPGITLPREIEAEQVAVPSAGCAGG